MTVKERQPIRAVVLGLIWIAAITAGYYVVNAGYYQEKLRVFGHFLIGSSG